ncbi:MAG: gluconokinase [Bacillota bacterium]
MTDPERPGLEFGVRPRTILIMGVAGCGKSTVGELLARRLGWTYVDADWLHPAANVAKMSRGEPLTDDDRWPWLEAVSERIEEIHREGGNVVLACSALKRAYRDVLRERARNMQLVFLKGDRETIEKRLATRTGHYMPAALLASQLATLEEPRVEERPLVVSIEAAPEEIVEAIVTSR